MGSRILFKRQIIRSSVTSTHIDQFDFGCTLTDKIPVVVQVLEAIGEIKINIEVQVTDAIVTAITVGDTPRPRVRTTSDGCQYASGLERKRIA